ncbi:MAG: hypothetical protein F4Z71_13090 [Gammaproteobacteria bacterium]|nr:hypothetical protein [Gammaproteobacteria bacterium]
MPALLAGLASPATAQATVTVPPDWSLIPSGLGPGDKFRLLFLTSQSRDATSSNIAEYNSFVQEVAAAGHSAIRPYASRFRVLASTSAVDARDNTGTTGAGVPVYWLGSQSPLANNYPDLYDESWADFDAKDESGSSSTRDHRTFIWTGSTRYGRADATAFLGASPRVAHGNLHTRGRTRPLNQNYRSATESLPFYALSPVFEVALPVISLKAIGPIAETGILEGESMGFELSVNPVRSSPMKVAILVREEGTAFDNGAPDPYPGHVLPKHRGEFVVEIPTSGTAFYFVPTRAQTFLEKDTKVHLLVMKPTAGVRSIARSLPASRGGGVELGNYVTDGANTATIAVKDGTDSASAVTPEVRLHVHPEDTEVAEGGTIEWWLAMKPQPASDLAVNIDIADGVKPNSNVGECGQFLAAGEAGRRTVTVPGYGGGLPRQSWNWVRFTVPTVDDSADEHDCDVVATIAAGGGYKVIEHEGVTIEAQGKATVRVTDNDEAESSQDSEGHPKQDSEVVRPVVTLTRDAASVTEGGAASFTLTADRRPPDPLPVWVDYKETRGSGETRRVSGGSAQVVIPQRGLSVTWTLATEDDAVWLADGAAVATLRAGEGYAVGDPSSATVAIVEDDPEEETEDASQDEADDPQQDEVRDSTGDEAEDARRVAEDVAAAVAFWQVRNNPAKLQYWLEIQSALETGEVSDDLMARVTVSWNGASPGGRFYATWEGVYNRFVALRAAADDDGQTRTQTDGATVFGGGSAMEAPDAAPRIPAGTTPAGLLSGPGSGVCVSARLRAEAAGRAGETWLGQAHVERWLRVLWTFSGGAGDATVVTPAEADFHAAAGGLAHWLPVADALRCLEARALEDALSR